MPGLAAIYNENQNNEGCDIQVFYNTSQNTLGMIMKSAGPAKDLNTRYETDGTTTAGPIVNPSQLAVARIQGVNMVVAVTYKPGQTGEAKDAKEYDISLISPVYQPLTTTLAKYTNVALSTKGDEGWVYFISGADVNKLRIQEANLTSAGGTSELNVASPFAGTRLAAYYDPKLDQRFVICQQARNDASGELYEFNVITGLGGPISGTGDSLPRTLITAAYINGTVALYYADNNGRVKRIYKKNGQWEGSRPIVGDGAQDGVDADSQLTSAVAGDKVHLYWLQSKNTKRFSHNVDNPLA